MLALRQLRTVFPGPRGEVAVVDGVDLEVAQGEILGLVGESGSGKSMTLRSILRLVRPPGRIEGEVIWQGRDLLTLSAAAMRRVRGREIGIIFQEPMTALNPVLSVGAQILESLAAHTDLDARARRARAVELLDLVGIPAATQRLADYPHQFSGGMRQRAMIAIALASNPRLLLADEPTTALDVTIQDQILRLLLRLRETLGMTVLLVTHDLGVVAQICDRVAVMYAGRIVEVGSTVDVFVAPRHAYTLGLLRSLPDAGRERQKLRAIGGAPPAPGSGSASCAFAPRCFLASPACAAARPEQRDFGGGHGAACIHAERVTAAEPVA
jgi:peptide/nickel transport system ATP-binding protein/oligopeptide transport system ATP-binding protein